MPDLQATTPLGATAPRREDCGALSLRERTDLGLATLALRAHTARPEPFGLALPGPGAMVENDRASAFWTGPDQWMLTLADAAESDGVDRLCAEAPGASVTEQTDGWAVFEIATREAATPRPVIDRLLERLVNLPPDATAPGRATRTLLHHMSVFVVRPRADTLLVLGLRSTAVSLHHALHTSAERLEIPS